MNDITIPTISSYFDYQPAPVELEVARLRECREFLEKHEVTAQLRARGLVASPSEPLDSMIQMKIADEFMRFRKGKEGGQLSPISGEDLSSDLRAIIDEVKNRKEVTMPEKEPNYSPLGISPLEIGEEIQISTWDIFKEILYGGGGGKLGVEPIFGNNIRDAIEIIREGIESRKISHEQK